MTSVQVHSVTVVGASDPLDAAALAHACGAGVDWVVQLVEVGIIELPAPRGRPESWRFRSSDLQQALEARRLERNFGAGLDAAALILDLQRELRHLRSVLAAQGLDHRSR